MRIATMSVGGVHLEIIQPTGPGPYQDFIDKHGEGLHHIQVKSPDNAALREHLDEAGLPRLMSGTVDIDDEDSLDYVLHDATKSLHLLVETVVGNRAKLLGLPAAVVTGDEAP
jgi:methylmalonyl-CoA/ethylmalonyl-CoA epimerase